MALALVITLVLGGTSVARALTVPALDAKTDLEFSLDGSTWTDAPDSVLGAWGCDLEGAPGSRSGPGSGSAPGSDEAIGGSTGVDPCAMSPGEYIDRTYYVRNSTSTGRTGQYEVGIGQFLLSPEAEFTVRSEITGATASGAGGYTLYGADTSSADETPAAETRLAALQLAPGASAKVVDTVSVPESPENYEQDQSISPRIWVKFSESGEQPPGGGGSSDLPDIVWPIIVGGVIGVIVAIIAPWLGSSAGSLGSSGSSGSSGAAAGSSGAAAPGAAAGSARPGAASDDGAASDNGAATDGSGPGDDSTVNGTTGQIPVETITPREASPPDEWARANSDVRTSLPTTGVDAADLLLWALTAAAAGATLILFVKRRRARDSAS